jgi:hypothetical protein
MHVLHVLCFKLCTLLVGVAMPGYPPCVRCLLLTLYCSGRHRLGLGFLVQILRNVLVKVSLGVRAFGHIRGAGFLSSLLNAKCLPHKPVSTLVLAQRRPAAGLPVRQASCVGNRERS